MPSFGGRIGRHLGETVSTISATSTSPNTLGGLKSPDRSSAPPASQQQPTGDSRAHRELSAPPFPMSPTVRPMQFKRRRIEVRGVRAGALGVGVGAGGFAKDRWRVEKPYGRRSARSSRRSSPDTFAQLTPTNGYLKYHEITLLFSDIKALKDDWLTDTNIAFWEEYIEHEILPKYPEAHIGLMRPSLVALMVQAERLRDIHDALPDFRNDTHIFLPISDSINAGRRADTGSHWSLLLVSKLDGVAFHYDSMNDHNDSHARYAVERLSRHLLIPLRFYRILEMPQQTNSSDCGVIVCILMRHLLVKKLLNANAREKVSMSLAGKQIDAHGGRKEMFKIIEQLRKEGERRRSTGALPLTLRSGNSPPYID